MCLLESLFAQAGSHLIQELMLMLHFLPAEPLGVAGIQPSEGLEDRVQGAQNRFGVQMHTHPTSF